MESGIVSGAPVELHEDSILALGYVTTYFSELEWVVHVMIWQLLRLRSLEKGMDTTARMRLSVALKLLSRLSQMRISDNSRRQVLSEFVAESKRAGSARRQLLRRHWLREDSSSDTRHIMDVAHQILDTVFLGRRTFDQVFGCSLEETRFFTARPAGGRRAKPGRRTVSRAGRR
jgi:hypothetical protein